MDKSKFYKVLGLPNNASAEEVSEKYKFLIENYRPLIQSGKLDVSALTELNMAYAYLMTDDITIRNKAAIKTALAIFCLSNKFEQRQSNIDDLITALIDGNYFDGVVGVIAKAVINYAKKNSAWFYETLNLEDISKIGKKLYEYYELEADFMSEFAFTADSPGQYYKYCTEFMAPGVLSLEEVSLFNKALTACTDSDEIIVLIKNNLDFIVRLELANEQMLKKYYSDCGDSGSKLSLFEIKQLKQCLTTKVSDEVIKNKFSLDDLVDFYLSGNVQDIRKQAAESLGIARKLNK